MSGNALDMMLVGSLVVMGLITVPFFYFLRRRDPTPLWFGLFCVSLAAHLLVGENEPTARLLLGYVSLTLLALFLRTVYPDAFSRRPINIIIAFGIVAGAASFVLPTRLHNFVSVPTLAATLVAVAWMVYSLGTVAWRGRTALPLLLMGMPLLHAAMMWNSPLLRVAIVPLALAFFILGPSLFLAIRFARALEEEARRSQAERGRVTELDQKLRNQAKFTYDLVDSVPVAVSLRDATGRYLFVNSTWEQWFGSSRESVIGSRVQDRLPVDEAEKVLSLDRAALERGLGSEGEISEFEFRGRRFTQNRKLLADERGEILGVLVGSMDTTDRYSQEQKLRELAKELADRNKFITEVIESLPVSVVIRDTEARHVQVNRTWERYYNVKREDILGKRFIEFEGWKDDPELVEFAQAAELIDREALERGPDQPLEAMERRRKGRTYLNTRRALVDTAGRPMGIVGVSLDITEQKAMAEALSLEERRLALVVRAAKTGIIDWDGVTRATWYSPRFREMAGYSPDGNEPLPDYLTAMVHPEDRERFASRWRDFMTGMGPDGRYAELFGPDEHRVQRADGNYMWVEMSGVALRNATGFITRWIAAMTDITERRKQEEALLHSVALREEVDRISRHDLKTPVNSVIAVSRLLREGGRLPPEDQELLATVESAGYRILNMVNLSLDLFRMEQGVYQFRPQAVDLDEVASKVAADLQGQAASKNVSVEVHRSRRVVVRAEELLCYSIFANLVKNAIEAAPEGTRVSIDIGREGETGRAHVHNEGVVPIDVRATFFEKYSTAGKRTGVGLGTYSAHLLARVQGGELTLQTAEDEGTTLTLRLALAHSEDTRRRMRATKLADPAALPVLPAMRVLVADDDEFNRLVLRRHLPSPPLNVLLVVNGRAALDAAQREWPDAALLDLEMPVLDGYETARRLREAEKKHERKRCLIVAISSNDEDHIMKRALAAGCDHYLVKPASRETLWKLLAGVSVPISSGGAPESHAQASDRIELDPDLESTLPAFLASRREALEEMPRALSMGDRDTFRRLAHRLAGSFALYGFRWAAVESKALERDAAEGEVADLVARTTAIREHLGNVKIHVPSKDAVTS